MQLAAHRLRTTSDSISQIARSVGYTSEHAFNRAFTRVLGTPPGRFRSLGRSNGTDAMPASNGSAPYHDN
jgi:AraC-like DNA-binding protein